MNLILVTEFDQLLGSRFHGYEPPEDTMREIVRHFDVDERREFARFGREVIAEGDAECMFFIELAAPMIGFVDDGEAGRWMRWFVDSLLVDDPDLVDPAPPRSKEGTRTGHPVRFDRFTPYAALTLNFQFVLHRVPDVTKYSAEAFATKVAERPRTTPVLFRSAATRLLESDVSDEELAKYLEHVSARITDADGAAVRAWILDVVERLDHLPVPSPNPAKRIDPAPPIKAATRWTDEDTARRITQIVFQDYQAEIKDWAGGSGADTRTWVFEGNAEESIGDGVLQGDTEVTPMYRAVIVLERPDDGEWFVQTGYPIP